VTGGIADTSDPELYRYGVHAPAVLGERDRGSRHIYIKLKFSGEKGHIE